MKLTILFFVAFCSILLYSQKDGENLPDYAGKVNYKYNKLPSGYDYAQKYSKQEEAEIQKKLEALADYLKKNPLISKPKGVEIFLDALVSEVAPLSKWTNKLCYQLFVGVYPWFVKNGKPAWKCAECVAGFTFHFNRPDLIFNGTSIEGLSNILDKDGILMGVEPIKMGEQNGCTAYENGIIVITKDQPVFVPVSVKEYDEALIRRYELVKKERPDEAYANDIVINRIKEEMASFSPEDLKKQAFVGARFGGSPCGDESQYAQRIVKMNPACFSKSKSRTDVQLIIIKSGSIGAMNEGSIYNVYEYTSFQSLKAIDIMKSIDFSELKKFFD